jgi:site-specific recombinase XerC
MMSGVDVSRVVAGSFERSRPVDVAQRAVAGFLARYSGQTLDAYRHDLRVFFQWASDTGIEVLAATRPHIELYRCWLEEQGLAAATVDRRLSTVCGFYRFAHIDGHVSANPRSTCAAPRSIRPTREASTAPSSRRSCSPRSATTMTTPPWRCCWVSTGARE